jgi:hypothetical protein
MSDKEPEFILVRDHGIPKRIREPKGSKYPLPTMHIGDALKFSSEKAVKAAALSARNYTRQHPNIKFSTFKLESGDYVLVRVS